MPSGLAVKGDPTGAEVAVPSGRAVAPGAAGANVAVPPGADEASPDTGARRIDFSALILLLPIFLPRFGSVSIVDSLPSLNMAL